MQTLRSEWNNIASCRTRPQEIDDGLFQAWSAQDGVFLERRYSGEFERLTAYQRPPSSYGASLKPTQYKRMSNFSHFFRSVFASMNSVQSM